jgi:hypothetical protein
VSGNRRGLERSTYFLQLPYRYGIPLLGFSAVLHWLASQSLSVVAVEVYNMNGVHNSSEYAHTTKDFPPHELDLSISCGHDFISMAYSPLGVVLSLAVVVVLCVALYLLGQKKLNPMPLVGSCSLAIAASCHVSITEQVPWEKSLRWGVLKQSIRRSLASRSLIHSTVDFQVMMLRNQWKVACMLRPVENLSVVDNHGVLINRLLCAMCVTLNTPSGYSRLLTTADKLIVIRVFVLHIYSTLLKNKLLLVRLVKHRRVQHIARAGPYKLHLQIVSVQKRDLPITEVIRICKHICRRIAPNTGQAFDVTCTALYDVMGALGSFSLAGSAIDLLTGRNRCELCTWPKMARSTPYLYRSG